MPNIQLLDGKKIPFKNSINGFDLAKKISKSLEKIALIMEVDGKLKDLSHEITKDSNVKIITAKIKLARGPANMTAALCHFGLVSNKLSS